MVESSEPRKRILLVDDEQKILKFLEVKLRLSGYEVITATSGRQALELVKSAKPDIMLLDVIMPEMDGFDVLQKLRTFTQLPVIVFSARAGNSDKAMSLGANDYIAKPFNLDELVTRVKALVDHTR